MVAKSDIKIPAPMMKRGSLGKETHKATTILVVLVWLGATLSMNIIT